MASPLASSAIPHEKYALSDTQGFAFCLVPGITYVTSVGGRRLGFMPDGRSRLPACYTSGRLTRRPGREGDGGKEAHAEVDNPAVRARARRAHRGSGRGGGGEPQRRGDQVRRARRDRAGMHVDDQLPDDPGYDAQVHAGQRRNGAGVVEFSGALSLSSNSLRTTGFLRLTIDGVQQGPGVVPAIGANERGAHAFNWQAPLAAGSHIARIQWRTDLGGTLCADARSMMISPRLDPDSPGNREARFRGPLLPSTSESSPPTDSTIAGDRLAAQGKP